MSLAAGNLSRLRFPPEVCRVCGHSSTRSPDLAALTVLAIVVLLSGMMRSASEASLSTAWVLHCTMTLTSCDQCVFL